MEVEEWFAARDSAYADFESLEEYPDASREDVELAHRRFREVRWLLRKWKCNESPEWRAEWRACQRARIGALIDELRGGPRWEQDGMEDA